MTQEISPRMQRAIELRLQGLCPKAIGERLGLTKSGVSKIFARARLKGISVPSGPVK